MFISDLWQGPQSSVPFLLIMSKEHPFVADFICLFSLHLLLWSQNYLISQLNVISCFILEELYKTHWTFSPSVEGLSFCLIDFVGSFLSNVSFLFEMSIMLWWSVFCFFTMPRVSQQALSSSLYYNRKMTLCHAWDLGLFYLRGITLLGQWSQIEYITSNLQAPERMF